MRTRTLMLRRSASRTRSFIESPCQFCELSPMRPFDLHFCEPYFKVTSNESPRISRAKPMRPTNIGDDASQNLNVQSLAYLICSKFRFDLEWTVRGSIKSQAICASLYEVVGHIKLRLNPDTYPGVFIQVDPTGLLPT